MHTVEAERINLMEVGALHWLADVVRLGKPRLSSLVIFTMAGGVWLAPGPIDWPRAIMAIVATTLLVGAANALNCFWERDIDRHMLRTQDRPLPAGRLSPNTALYVGGVATLVSGAMLYAYSNALTFALGMLAFFSYVFVYTPMKSRTPWAVVVGALPGALPPLMGWTTVTNSLTAGGVVLFSILFVWQLPHFLAISIFRKDEYARAGLKVFAWAYGNRATQWGIAVTAVLLVPTVFALVPLGLASPWYGVPAGVLSSGLVVWAFAGFFSTNVERWARQFFFATLIFLTLLMVALLVGAR